MVSDIDLEQLVPGRYSGLESVLLVVVRVKVPCNVCSKSIVDTVKFFAQLCKSNLNPELIIAQNPVVNLKLGDVGAKLFWIVDFLLNLFFFFFRNVPLIYQINAVSYVDFLFTSIYDGVLVDFKKSFIINKLNFLDAVL